MKGRRFERGGLAVGLALTLSAAQARAQQADPPSARSPFAAALVQKMQAHPYLRRTVFEAVEDHPPYLFFVQRSTDPSARKAGEVAAATAALLEPVRARFEREIARPLGLAQRADTPALAVIVLGSQEAFQECYRVNGSACYDTPRATFAREVGAAVLYDDSAEARAAGEQARNAQHVFVHALQWAFHSGQGLTSVRSWLFEGMADFLARPEAGPDFPAPARLSEFVSDTRAPETRWAHLRTLEEMCAVDEPLGLQPFFDARTSDPSLLSGPGLDTWEAFYRQATLLYAFLASAGEEKARAGLSKCLARWLAGSRSAETLAASFAPETLEQLEQAFLAWIQREHKRAFTAEKVKPELVLAALSRADLGALTAAEAAPSPKPRVAATEKASAATPSAPRASPSAPARALAVLSIADATPDERLAWAISEIASGRLRAGRARLAELEASQDPAFAARAQREALRAAAWEAARDAFLQRIVEEKSLLHVELPPPATANEFGVRSYSEGMVELDDKKGGIRRVHVEALDAFALAREMRSGPSEADWTRIYIFILKENKQWKGLLKEDSQEAKSLFADALADYPARLQLGKAMAKVASLAERPLPKTPREAEQRVEVLRSLFGEHAGTSIVTRNREKLRAHAQALFERRFELLGAQKFLGGKLEALPGERVRITYDFKDPRELDDFESTPYPPRAGRSLGTTKAADVPFQVSRGALVALGQASLRTLYDLEAPLTVRYAFTFEDGGDGASNFRLALGVCDDEAEHFIWAINLGSLQRYEHLGAPTLLETDASIPLGRANTLELQHDGQRVRLLCEGKERCSLEAGARQYGAVFLRASTDLGLSIEKLVIEGRQRADGFERMKRVWAQRQVAGL